MVCCDDFLSAVDGATMSRINMEPKDPGHEVVVGLDAPMNTFFIIVSEKQSDDDLRDLDPIEFKAKWSRSEVVAKIEQYAKKSPRRQAVMSAINMDMDPADFVKKDT